MTSFSLHADSSWQDVERIVAIGDVHGDYDNFFEVLQGAGIVNRRGNWRAGDTHLVQLGDLPDRGPDTAKIIELMMKLERQARRRGGMVHVLIGNHEAMNILGDLRYVHPGEYEAFVNRNSPRLRDRYFELVLQNRMASQPDFEPGPEFRQQFDSEIPLGYVEHRIAWGPEGEYGSWVLEHNAIIRIGRTLFVHGGISPSVLGTGMEAINQGVRVELSLGEAGQRSGETGLATLEDGPLWYRGLALNDETLESPHVDAILAHYDVDRIVIGHTPGLGTIAPRFDAKVLVIDSGISDYYGGYLTSLTIEGNQLINIQNGEHLEIPTGDADVIPYFEAAARLAPDLRALQEYLYALKNPEQVEFLRQTEEPEQPVSGAPQ